VIRWLIGLTTILYLAISAPLAQPFCGSALVMHGPFPDPQIVADGLAVALRGDALAIWPIAADNELNRGLAVELEFSDHAVCAVKLPEASARGATITIGRRDVSAVEAAVCDNEEGSCVPVRIVFPD
jgi:hypothetical protein